VNAVANQLASYLKETHDLAISTVGFDLKPNLNVKHVVFFMVDMQQQKIYHNTAVQNMKALISQPNVRSVDTIIPVWLSDWIQHLIPPWKTSDILESILQENKLADSSIYFDTTATTSISVPFKHIHGNSSSSSILDWTAMEEDASNIPLVVFTEFYTNLKDELLDSSSAQKNKRQVLNRALKQAHKQHTLKAPLAILMMMLVPCYVEDILGILAETMLIRHSIVTYAKEQRQGIHDDASIMASERLMTYPELLNLLTDILVRSPYVPKGTNRETVSNNIHTLLNDKQIKHDARLQTWRLDYLATHEPVHLAPCIDDGIQEGVLDKQLLFTNIRVKNPLLYYSALLSLKDQ
jgi:hypothetical protein